MLPQRPKTAQAVFQLVLCHRKRNCYLKYVLDIAHVYGSIVMNAVIIKLPFETEPSALFVWRVSVLITYIISLLIHRNSIFFSGL